VQDNLAEANFSRFAASLDDGDKDAHLIAVARRPRRAKLGVHLRLGGGERGRFLGPAYEKRSNARVHDLHRAQRAHETDL
jgi:hypothetical protein